MDWKLQVVVVPVADPDRALEFYAGRLGWNVDVDVRPAENFRIIQVTPPGSACSVTFGTGLSAMAPGSLHGLQLVVADIEAARAQLTEANVEAGPVVHFDAGEQKPGPGGDWNSFIFFSDPDGNGWTVQQGPARA